MNVPRRDTDPTDLDIVRKVLEEISAHAEETAALFADELAAVRHSCSIVVMHFMRGDLDEAVKELSHATTLEFKLGLFAEEDPPMTKALGERLDLQSHLDRWEDFKQLPSMSMRPNHE